MEKSKVKSSIILIFFAGVGCWKSGDSGFESRAGFSLLTRWPNGKAPDYGTILDFSLLFLSILSIPVRNSDFRPKNKVLLYGKKVGSLRGSNPGPPAPEAGIIPLDQVGTIPKCEFLGL